MPKEVIINIPPTGENPMPSGLGSLESFKDKTGRFRTRSLFREYSLDSYPAYFTLRDEDTEGYPSLYRKYMEIGDPTEYRFAVHYFGKWEHWEILSNAGWFKKNHLDRWRKELKVKMESDRFAEMTSMSKGEGPQAIQATKWLAERYGDKKPTKRGRPSNEEKAGHLKKAAEEQTELAEDAARVGLLN